MTLFPFQQEALEQTAMFRRVAYYYDMGLGKTYIGAEKMVRLGAKVNVVICQKSKVNDWIDHFRKNYPQFTVYDATSKKKADKRVLEYGFWINYRNGSFRPSIIVINYELAWRKPELLELTGFTLLLDESSMIQNDKAKRTKFVLKMQPENVILLSGTPTAGKYENLWSQCHLLGWKISKRAYWNTYLITERIPGIPVPLVKGYKNVDRLKAKLKEYGAVFKKTDEVMDLPQQNDIPVLVDTTKEYQQFVKTNVIQLKNGLILMGDTTLTRRLYMRQLCGMYNKAKLEAFRDLVASTGDRLIVFYNFTYELTEMQQILMDSDNSYSKRFSVVNGQIKALQNYEDKSDSITFVQYQAGAMGLNLQKANKIVYFTLPERSELFEQSRKRIHRIGQERPCFYYFLMCRNSIEQKVKAALDMRKDYTDELFRKDFTPWLKKER